MSHRSALPQLEGGLFLTDGGLETTLIFLRGRDLPAFAAFDLLKDDEGTEELRRYFDPYLEEAAKRGAGFILESPTWRASPDWAEKIGYTPEQLDQMNRKAIELMAQIRDASDVSPIVISGCVGPQDDGYDPEVLMSAEEAQRYHSIQIGTFAETAADMVTAITMTYVEEALGIARAAEAAGLPVAISFTVETDGRLPGGQPLGEAIEQTDAETGGYASYFMVNCAHPTHFDRVVADGGGWTERIRGLRTNASTMSHAELDEAEELDDGNPADLARRHAELRDALPRLNVLGGCCGTDHRHVAEISNAWR